MCLVISSMNLTEYGKFWEGVDFLVAERNKYIKRIVKGNIKN